MTRKKNSRKKSPELANVSQKILNIVRKAPQKLFNYKELAAKMGVDDAGNRNKIIRTLAQLAAKKKIEEVERGKFKFTPGKDTYTGIVDISSRGGCFVVVEELEEDIFVPQMYLNHALHGDQVEVYVYKARKNKHDEGEITKILARKRTEFVG